MKKTVIVLLMLISIPLFAPVHNELYYEIKKVDINALMREREIDRILTAIKIIESGGDYEAVGQSFEIGAYEFINDDTQSITEYNHIGYHIHELKRMRWQRLTYPVQFEKIEALRKLIKPQ